MQGTCYNAFCLDYDNSSARSLTDMLDISSYRNRPHFKDGPFLLASLLAGVAALMPVARNSLLKYSTHSLMVSCMQFLDSPCKHCAAVQAGIETEGAGAEPALRHEIVNSTK